MFLRDRNGRTIGDVNPLPVKLVSGGVSSKGVKLLDKVTVAGNSLPQSVGSTKSIRFDVWGTATSFSLQIEAAGDSGTYRPLQIWDVSGNMFVNSNTITSAGLYEVDVQGLINVRAKVNSVSGGNVSASGQVIG